MSWFRHRREPDPDAVAAVEQAHQDSKVIEQQRAEALPVVTGTRQSLERNGWGEAIAAALQGRRTA